MITVSLGAIERLARAIDFHLPPGWPDELGQKVVEAAAVRVGNVEQLRDRFAMAALTGLLGANDSRDSTVAPWREQSNDVVARAAYEYADAMLAARASKPAATETP